MKVVLTIWDKDASYHEDPLVGHHFLDQAFGYLQKYIQKVPLIAFFSGGSDGVGLVLVHADPLFFGNDAEGIEAVAAYQFEKKYKYAMTLYKDHADAELRNRFLQAVPENQNRF